MKDLDELINNSSLEVKRALSVKLIKLGLPLVSVCETLNVTPSFVKKWRAIYHKEGAINFKPKYKGSQGLLDETARKEIQLYISDKETCTLEELISYINEKYGVSFKSKQSYYALFKEAGMSWKKTEKLNPKKDETLVIKKKEAIKKNLKKDKVKYFLGIWSY